MFPRSKFLVGNNCSFRKLSIMHEKKASLVMAVSRNRKQVIQEILKKCIINYGEGACLSNKCRFLVSSVSRDYSKTS